MKVSKVEKIHRILRPVPHWLLTVVCLLAILYLTLVPDPLGDEEIPLFDGADKLVHGIMFFGLVLCALVDAQRVRGWRPLSLPLISLITLLGMGIGIGIEYLQFHMDLGRGMETADMIADAAGAVIAGTMWIFVGGILRMTDSESRHDTET